jgi:succinate dehydrogenase flavin-adding protein (antitoxin of CptAB toxin-antitoxin module)
MCHKFQEMLLLPGVETTLESMKNKTKITIKWKGRAKILTLKILFPFISSKMVKQAQKELNNFKQLVETKGADFSK